MRKKRIIFIILSRLFIFISVICFCHCDKINFLLIKKPILPESMMKGYINVEAKTISYIGDEDREPDDELVGYFEFWTRKQSDGRIRIHILIYKSKKDAMRYGEFKGSTGKGWKDGGYFGKGFGDKHWILISKDAVHHISGFVLKKPIVLVFVKGNTAVELVGNGPYGDPPSESHEFFEKVARYIESKL